MLGLILLIVPELDKIENNEMKQRIFGGFLGAPMKGIRRPKTTK